jgi:hypothetical protein
MRKLFLVGCIIYFAVAMPLTAAETVSAEAKTKVAAILVQFPDGGAGLSDAIAAAVEADPSLTRAVVAAALSATAAQQQAIGAGLAAAAMAFDEASTGTGADAEAARKAQQEIQTAMASAPTLAQTGFAAYSVAFTGNTTNGIGTSQCVSANQGNGRCNGP